MTSVETRLRRYSLILRGDLDVGKVKRLIETLEGIENDVKHGPMRKVFEAKHVEVEELLSHLPLPDHTSN